MAPAILNFGNGWELGIGSTAQPLCYGEEYPGVYWIARWVRPRASLGFLEKREISCPSQESNHDSSNTQPLA